MTTRTWVTATDADDARFCDLSASFGLPVNEVAVLPATWREMEVGADNEQCRSAVRFQPDIPKGATIVSASLWLVRSNGQATAGIELYVYGYREADLPAFDNTHTHLPNLHGDGGFQTNPVTGWILDGGNSGPVATPDLSPLVQALVSRADWVPGSSSLGLVIAPAPTAGAFWLDFEEHSSVSVQYPALTVTWR
jgi:hypothetical protein